MVVSMGKGDPKLPSSIVPRARSSQREMCSRCYPTRLMLTLGWRRSSSEVLRVQTGAITLTLSWRWQKRSKERKTVIISLIEWYFLPSIQLDGGGASAVVSCFRVPSADTEPLFEGTFPDIYYPRRMIVMSGVAWTRPLECGLR